MSTGTTILTEVPSATLGEPIACTLYLPPGYQHGPGQHGPGQPDPNQPGPGQHGPGQHEPGQHGPGRYPVLYLLHGRGDSMNSFDRAVRMLDELIGDGRVPPVIAVAPDAPWSGRGGWYVDSAYTGDNGHGAGRPVETALVRDLVPAVDAAYRTIATRTGRVVGGYSMGGAGALRLALAHQRLFAHALVLSPAVYVPLPPAGSNTRVFGAYGSGERVFDEDAYRRLSYPALLPSVDPALPLHLFIAVGRGDYESGGCELSGDESGGCESGGDESGGCESGGCESGGDESGGDDSGYYDSGDDKSGDDESGDCERGGHAQGRHAHGEHPRPAPRHDIGSEHEALYEAVRRIPGIRARARVLPGGHDWSTWLPALAEGLEFLGPLLNPVLNPLAAPPATAPIEASIPGAAAHPKDNQ